MGPVPGPPRPHHTRPGTTGDGHWLPAPRDGPPGEGKRLTQDAPHKGERSSPPGQPPTGPAAHSSSQGMHAKTTVPGPHAPTPAPTARGPRTATARPEGGRPGEDERLTSDAPHNGPRHPPTGKASRGPPEHATLARKSAHCGAGAGSFTLIPPATGKHGRQILAARPQGRRPGEGKRLTANAPRNGERSPPPGRPPTRPAARSPPQGMHARGTMPDPYARTPAPPARGQRTPTARSEGRRLAEDGRLTDLRRPSQQREATPPGDAPRQPRGAQRRLARACATGLLLGPHAHSTSARVTRAAGPGCPPPGASGRERDDLPLPPRRAAPPQGMHAKGTVQGPLHRTSAPTARGQRTSTASLEGGRPGEDERLTSHAPHNSARHPAPGTPSRHPHSAQRRLARTAVLGPPRSHHPRPGTTGNGARLPAPIDGRQRAHNA